MSNDYKKYVLFGTSSWAFEGWRNIVYFKDYPEGRFKRDCLVEYAADGHFSTVGMDLFFYQPPTESILQHYAKQLPPGFKTCSKVWEELTIYRYPNQHRYGKLKGQINKNFLNSNMFINRVLKPHERFFKDHTGPFIFEFQYMKKDDRSITEFTLDLDKFFSDLPNDFQYSVEIRNKNFLHTKYFDILKKHNVAHVFNQWFYMPPISEQMKHDAITSDFIVARLLTPIGMSYQESVKKFEPFDKLVKSLPEMRNDIMKLIEISIKEKKYAYLLINNRSEGCAPLTIQELHKMAGEIF